MVGIAAVSRSVALSVAIKVADGCPAAMRAGAAVAWFAASHLARGQLSGSGVDRRKA